MKKIIIIATVFCICIFLYYTVSPSRYKIKNSNSVSQTIICFGDSLTYGTGASNGMGYPYQLSKMIKLPVINLGIPGNTTTMALKRISEVLNLKPGIVILTLGGNDLKTGIPKDTAFNNLKIIINKIQNKGALVVIGGIDFPFFGKGFGDAYKILARQTGSLLIPNIYSGILGHPKLMNDRIHPNNAGYTVMAESFYKALKPYINSHHLKN